MPFHRWWAHLKASENLGWRTYLETCWVEPSAFGEHLRAVFFLRYGEFLHRAHSTTSRLSLMTCFTLRCWIRTGNLKHTRGCTSSAPPSPSSTAPICLHAGMSMFTCTCAYKHAQIWMHMPTQAHIDLLAILWANGQSNTFCCGFLTNSNIESDGTRNYDLFRHGTSRCLREKNTCLRRALQDPTTVSPFRPQSCFIRCQLECFGLDVTKYLLPDHWWTFERWSTRI